VLAIVALESQRHRCAVVAAGLEGMSDGARALLQSKGVLAGRVFTAGRDPGGAFPPPENAPEDASLCLRADDEPPLSGFWHGVDLRLRQELGLFPDPEARSEAVIARARSRAQLLLALEASALLPPGVTVDPISSPVMSVELGRAVHALVASTPCRLLVVDLADALGQEEPSWLPASGRAYPNWRVRLPVALEQWAGDERLDAVVAAVRHQRGGQEAPVEEPVGAGFQGLLVPRATYRIQLHRGFTFADAARVVPYLDRLGVSHCYTSPYLKARPGSTHGYDIIDHSELNPELGSAQDFQDLCAALARRQMGQVIDIVPNHMGVMGSDNAWWLDVLENGQASGYADYFDIDWEPVKPALRGKVLVPVLGDHYGRVLDRGELRLEFDAGRGAFIVAYYEHRFPVDPREYPRILAPGIPRLAARLGPSHPRLPEMESLVAAFGHLAPRDETDPGRLAERRRDREVLKSHLARLYREEPDITRYVEENLADFNGEGGRSPNRPRLHQLLEAQAYRLAFWRVAADEINYRRFFDINELGSLRMENPAVFAATHGLVRRLIAEGSVQGLRVDHPDGLYDPRQYFARLQGMVSGPGAREPPGARRTTGREPVLYVVAEKILAAYEHLPETWPVHGTTGYEFSNLVGGLLVDPRGGKALERTYQWFVGERIDPDELVYACKKLIMRVSLASELNVLASHLSRIAAADRYTCDYTLSSLRDALAEVVACFPVYRTYVTGEGVSPEDLRYVDWAVTVVRRRSLAADISVFDFVRDVLQRRAVEGLEPERRAQIDAFAMKFQQYTGPVMAKALEDTAFYRYNRLVSLNEVGADPRRFAVSVAAFHHANLERLKRWPYAMLSTSTHDSKRSEDVRARIHALSELPREWRQHVARWQRLNRRLKREVDGVPAPSPNDEYLLYQTLLGAWPLGPCEGEALECFRERIERYMVKAVREAKVHSSWVNPREDYEAKVVAFCRSLLEAPERNPFLADFLPFQERVARLGMLNGLTQTALKLCAPGVPDTYQGTELWDLSLVDPDNRRPVDFVERQRLLEEVSSLASPAEGLAGRVRALLDRLEDGRAKLYLTWRLLGVRRERPGLFRDGGYIPLEAGGVHARRLCAFARLLDPDRLVVVAPRLYAGLTHGARDLPLGETWTDTWIVAPEGCGPTFDNVLTGERVPVTDHAGRRVLLAPMVFSTCPVAALLEVPPRA
jgi:(1->4)-alpha-D-glucan 1-alpha-D-glucosylmutase